MNTRLVLAAFIAMVCISLHAQVNAEAYLPKKFDQILVERKECADPGSDLNMCAEIHKYQTRLTYLGQIRPITGRKAELLTGLQIFWKAQPNVVQFYAKYHQEILSSYKGSLIWVPIQDSLIPEVAQYLKTNDDFLAYLVIPGALKSELIFVLTRFDELN